MSSIRTQLLSTAQAFHEAHVAHDSSAVAALCAPDCKHHVGPSSLSSPERTTAEYIAVTEMAWKTFGKYETKVVDTLVDEAEKAVVMRVKTTGQGNETEYVTMMRMSDDGKAASQVYNFVDSKIVVEGMAKMGIQG